MSSDSVGVARFSMRILLFALCVALAGCTTAPRINTDHQSAAHSSRVQYIVLHYTASDLQRSLQLLTRGGLSSHYLIDDRSGTVYRLVDEDRRAWHVGDSEWQGRTWLNASTIGIELVNPGYTDGPQGRVWAPYSEKQIEALIGLLKDIVARHRLPPGSVVGHSDVAPQRKSDPGPLFPWWRLAEEGFIPWPDQAEVDRYRVFFEKTLPPLLWFQQQLARQGYRTPQSGELDEETVNILRAFQMKYRPADAAGQADAETAALLLVLNGQSS